MTVENTNTEISYTGNDSVTVFAYNFLVYDEDHLFVYLDDVEQTAGFAVSGVGEDSGGDVTFDVAPANNVTVKLERIVPLTQLIEYQQYGPFDAESNERGLDLATMQNIQVQKSIQEKMSKRESAAEDNIVIFDDAGDSKDSGVNINSIGNGSAKMDKRPSATENNIITFDSDGNSKDSGTPIQTINGIKSFVTKSELASGSIPVGSTVHVTDRANGVFNVVAGGAVDNIKIIDAGNGNTAVADTSNKSINIEIYGATSGNVVQPFDYAITELNYGVSEAANGGTIEFQGGNISLDGQLSVYSPVPFSVDSLTFKGKGVQSTLFDASGFAGDAINIRFPIYSTYSDFGVKGSTGNAIFIDDGVGNDESGFMNTFERLVLKNSASNGMYTGRCYITTFRNNEYLSNGEAGHYTDFRIHTSQLHQNEYARDNTGAGFSAEYLVYSSYDTCGSDENLNGYQMYGCRGVHFNACGGESNRRTAWYLRSDASHEVNWMAGTSLLAVNNNLDHVNNPVLPDYANHTEMLAEDDIVNFMALKQPVSLTSADQDPSTWDFKVQGRGAILSIEDPLMENGGTRSAVDGFIQVNYSAPKLIYQLNFNALQSRTLLLLKNQNGLTDDWSGKLLITVSNSAFGSSGAIGTATYELLVSKSLAGAEQTLVSSLGLVNGTSSTHPSFTFTAFAGGIFAQAVSQTTGDFWFAVEKIGGNIIWDE